MKITEYGAALVNGHVCKTHDDNAYIYCVSNCKFSNSPLQTECSCDNIHSPDPILICDPYDNKACFPIDNIISKNNNFKAQSGNMNKKLQTIKNCFSGDNNSTIQTIIECRTILGVDSQQYISTGCQIWEGEVKDFNEYSDKDAFRPSQ